MHESTCSKHLTDDHIELSRTGYFVTKKILLVINKKQTPILLYFSNIALFIKGTRHLKKI